MTKPFNVKVHNGTDYILIAEHTMFDDLPALLKAKVAPLLAVERWFGGHVGGDYATIEGYGSLYEDEEMFDVYLYQEFT